MIQNHISQEMNHLTRLYYIILEVFIVLGRGILGKFSVNFVTSTPQLLSS